MLNFLLTIRCVASGGGSVMNVFDFGLRKIAGGAKHNVFKVAIVGIGCRLPGKVDSPDTYWDLLLTKGCGIKEIPSDRWNVEAFCDKDPDAVGKGYARSGGFLDDIRGFDAAFFDISPREA